MKRVLALALVVCAAGVIAMVMLARTDGSNLVVETEAGNEPPVVAPTEPPPPGVETTATDPIQPTEPGAYPPVPAEARPATVRRLADGDSFDIDWSDTGERDEVRLYGINAPERGACFGDEARETLDVLVDGQTLLVAGVERDEFGRLLANVWVGDLFVNAALVELGAALSLSDDGGWSSLIAASQVEAEAAQQGLWSPEACGANPTPMSIVAIEYDAPGPDNQNPNGEWIEVLNTGTTPFDLTGWAIRDESTRHRFDFPDSFTIGPGEVVRVFSGCGDNTAEQLFWCGRDPVWNNGGDTGFLVDRDGRFADTYSYGE